MAFDTEADFERALMELLKTKGWENNILEHYTEAMLIQNWADILFENNRGIDRLNDYPLTGGEMQQILEQVRELKTPLRLNSFINGGSVAIIRDNPEDSAHFGKDWKRIGSTLLSIPMAHQLIGFYTVADDSDGVLKVMRSYQYYAANAI